MGVAGPMAMSVLFAATGLFPSPIPEGQRGTKEFYAATAQIIPTLVVALAIGLPGVLRLIRGTLTDSTFVVVWLANLSLMAWGEVSALQGLGCLGEGYCGTEETYRNVVLGLIASGGLLFATVILALGVTASRQRERR